MTFPQQDNLLFKLLNALAGFLGNLPSLQLISVFDWTGAFFLLVFCGSACYNGWVYKGLCLRAVKQTFSGDMQPSGCRAYQPSLAWDFSDYVSICQHFRGRLACGSIDYDRHGGRCSNFQAILAYENQHQSNEDVWVHRSTFAWNPSHSSSPDCQLVPNPPSTVVYACRV